MTLLIQLLIQMTFRDLLKGQLSSGLKQSSAVAVCMDHFLLPFLLLSWMIYYLMFDEIMVKRSQHWLLVGSRMPLLPRSDTLRVFALLWQRNAAVIIHRRCLSSSVVLYRNWLLSYKNPLGSQIHKDQIKKTFPGESQQDRACPQVLRRNNSKESWIHIRPPPTTSSHQSKLMYRTNGENKPEFQKCERRGWSKPVWWSEDQPEMFQNVWLSLERGVPNKTQLQFLIWRIE